MSLIVQNFLNGSSRHHHVNIFQLVFYTVSITFRFLLTFPTAQFTSHSVSTMINYFYTHSHSPKSVYVMVHLPGMTVYILFTWQTLDHPSDLCLTTNYLPLPETRGFLFYFSILALYMVHISPKYLIVLEIFVYLLNRILPS